MIPTNKDYTDLFGYQLHFRCTLPKATAANEILYFYGTFRGRAQGSGFVYPADIIGKTLWKKDSKATTTTQMDCKFKSTDFLNPDKPLLSEIVTALNAATTGWDDTTDTDASSGAKGQLVLAGAAADTTQTFEIGGDAAPLLGFDVKDGITVQIDNADFVNIVFPAYFAGKESNQWFYSRAPKVQVSALTVATGAIVPLAPVSGYTYNWLPESRTLEIGDGSGDAARVADILITL